MKIKVQKKYVCLPMMVYLRTGLGMVLRAVMDQDRPIMTGTKNLTHPPTGLGLWILPPSLTSRLSPLCLPRHWAGLSAHYMSPGLVSLPPASNPSSRPQLTSIHPSPCYRSLLLKLHYVAPPLPPLKLFTGSLWADPIKPRALSMSRDCGVWLLLAVSPASFLPTSLSTPHPTPPAPPSSFRTESETRDTALQGCGYQGLTVVKITWSCLKHKLLGYILTWFWYKGPHLWMWTFI